MIDPDAFDAFYNAAELCPCNNPDYVKCCIQAGLAAATPWITTRALLDAAQAARTNADEAEDPFYRGRWEIFARWLDRRADLTERGPS